ncbi:MAG: tRNA (N6-threonylcarbamoyladenosine(37)-N6)-methyltransferase TrmO [Chloroflexota bacterium]|nr:tRNA (N6-threonylcarbamoyladenosine(37)-N6)-methyltransferase TrmO [Chloroflexota bacterium]
MNKETLSEITLRPIGVIKSTIKEPGGFGQSINLSAWQARVERMKEQRKAISEIVIDNDLVGLLDGIEDFSQLLVLYWAHQVPAESRSISKVHPMGRADFPLVGVLATRSPARPNPVLATTVRLLERKGNVLRVEGLDALDDSPLIDIKPDTPEYHVDDKVKMPDWMMEIRQELDKESPPSTASEETL